MDRKNIKKAVDRSGVLSEKEKDYKRRMCLILDALDGLATHESLGLLAGVNMFIYSDYTERKVQQNAKELSDALEGMAWPMQTPKK